MHDGLTTNISHAALPRTFTPASFESVFDSIPTPLLVITPDFTMVAANEARLRATGRSRHEVIGQPLFDIFPDNPNDPSIEGVRNLKASLERVLREKVADTMAVQRYDIPVPGSPTGEFERRYWSPTNIPVLNAQGELTHIIHRVEDVTSAIVSKNSEDEMLAEIYQRTEEVRIANLKLKEANDDLERRVNQRTAQLRESESRFRSIANTLPQIVWTTTPDGYVDWFNDWWYQYTGRCMESRPEDTEPVVHPDDLKKVFAYWDNAMVTEVLPEIEVRVRRQDGQYRWHISRGVPIRRSNGTIEKWVGASTDIHDQKILADQLLKTQSDLRLAKEAAEAASQTKSAFLANMSHEIRTPLGAIIGFSSLLKEQGLDATERNQFVDTIVRNGEALTRIIDDILDLAKVEAGRLEIERVDVSIYDLTSDVVELFKDKAKEKGIRLLLSIDENVPARILSDPTRLRQILVNLIGNAVKFTSRGGVRINIATDDAGQDHVKVTVSVKDSGIGLTDDQRKRLFQPFAQADNSTTRKFGGTGLGLALSQRLAQALNGHITIEPSSPESGALFTLVFTSPVSDNDAPVSNRQNELTEIDPELLRGVLVLVVDDSTDNQFLVGRLLSGSGALVETAKDGEEAVEKALRGSHDLILMDIQMPNMDGFQAKHALDLNGYQKPVVALTAHAMVDEQTKTIEAGFKDHLTKPLNRQKLLDVVARFSGRLH